MFAESTGKWLGRGAVARGRFAQLRRDRRFLGAMDRENLLKIEAVGAGAWVYEYNPEGKFDYLF
ncbi:hypothetical protein [Tabrizicola sp. BL-A-41-H6]|uniref:hypothetical protein n=1 Tax=Tabrizicola sp. BL-A-41-H6 TaxID=3421107 RepID=UPI003D67F1E2